MTSLSQKSLNNSLTRANAVEITDWGMPDFDNGIYYSNSAPSEFTAPYDCYCVVKGATLAYDLFKPDGTTPVVVEYVLSANYTSSHVFIKKGYILKQRATSTYNLFAYWPLVGGEH